MTGKERFQRTMHFEPIDRAPMIEVGCWEQTRERWLKEGMPAGTGLEESALTFNGNEFFGLDKQVCINLNLGPLPAFEDKIIEDDGRIIVRRNSSGAVTRGMKDGSSMAQYISFPVQNRSDFLEMKKRYDPLTPERYPEGWKTMATLTKNSDCPVWGPGIGSVGLYSMLRTWMGTENACTIFYDDPALAHEMVEFIAEFTIQVMEHTLKEARLDYFLWWEDFSFKTGPLVSPYIFKEFLMSGYRRVNDTVKSYGIDIIVIDTDGDPRVLIPLIMETGINCLYPLEQCCEGVNPLVLRKEYGHDLLLWGGIDKRVLAKGKQDIDKELYEKIPALIKDGGYIPQLDHLAPPDISYENWLYYLEQKARLLFIKG